MDESPDRTSGTAPLRVLPEGRLQDILAAHQRWLQTRGREGGRANLAEVDLRRTNLQLAVLSEASLQGANLERALLEGARLQGADMQRALLRGAELSRASLQRANLQGADLFEANLEDAGLSEANLQAANLFVTNLRGVDLQRATLQRALLKEASMQGADLQGANLYGANLQGADLRGANLRRACLREAQLTDANLRGADLQEADLQGGNLHHAALQQANVRDADLTGVTGLLARQLAGADVAAARLPPTLQTFAGLASLRDLVKHARRLWLWLLLGCALAWLIIAATTDAMLLTNAPAALLPRLITPIPSNAWYIVMPLVFLGLYVYFHLYLQRLWEALADLPAVFPDGRPLDQAAYPWLLHGLVRAHVWRLRYNRPPLSRLQASLAILLAWWIVPLTLVLFWARYLPGHDWRVTVLHITALVAAIGFAILFQGLARTLLRGRAIRPYTHGAVALVLAFAIDVAFSFLSFGALTGVPPQLYTTSQPPELPAPPLKESHIRRLVPRLFALTGYSPFANLTEAEVSTRLTPRAGQEAEPLAAVVGARLQGRNLRYASAFRAFLVNADLRGADLFRADLRQADLRGARFDGAALHGANLVGANLTYATGLTKEQLATALTDATTRLPDFLGGVPSPYR
jgi:uncharacterized protein YjbI with pentapeptide repeats